MGVGGLGEGLPQIVVSGGWGHTPATSDSTPACALGGERPHCQQSHPVWPSLLVALLGFTTQGGACSSPSAQSPTGVRVGGRDGAALPPDPPPQCMHPPYRTRKQMWSSPSGHMGRGLQGSQETQLGTMQPCKRHLKTQA